MHRLSLALLLAFPAVLPAQSLLYRSPNLGGTWTGEAGVVQFNFLHRFYVAPSGGSNKVTNFPSFLVGVGLADRALVGVRYASNSTLVPPAVDYRPNEIELLARVRLLGADAGAGFGLAVTPAYNAAAESFDAEAAVDYTTGRLTLEGAGRFASKPFGVSGGDAKFTVAGGLSLRLNDYIAVGGDVAQLLAADTSIAWSAGLSFVIPGSPHTFSLHASNSTSTTIQGSSLEGLGKVIYGFEFTIPLHLSRFAPWFGKRAARDEGGAAAATVHIAQLKFQTDTVRIAAGQSVRWINDDELVHTVTFTGGAGGSGELAKGASFTMRFDRPGTYAYACTPHPFMSGVVVVR
jgi:amicyanin